MVHYSAHNVISYYLAIRSIQDTPAVKAPAGHKEEAAVTPQAKPVEVVAEEKKPEAKKEDDFDLFEEDPEADA
jgi:hypothetical protein